MLALCVPVSSIQAQTSELCTPGISNVTAAPATDAGQRPHQGWVSVTLPDYWQTRWPDTNEVWYRIHWHHCQLTEPPALTIGQISMAAEIYLNDSLLSRSASLHEPYSRSWNMPQYWVLPAAALLPGDNTLWLRVTGNPYDRLGLGSVYIGDIASAESIYQTRYRVQRQTFILNAALSLALGGLFLILWAVRRSETAFAWFGLASMLWAVFAFTMLATTPWPFSNSIDWNRVIVVLLTLYCCTFCFFTWRFGEQEYPRFSRILVAVTAILAIGVWWLPDSWMPLTLVLVLPAYALLFLGNCLQFQFHAWRQREKHITLLAVCLLLFLIVCLHDVVTVIFPPADPFLWAPVSSPIAMLFMFIIVAERYAQSFRRIEQFNVELQSAVETTRADLTETLQHKHQLETSNIRLTERLALSHDLHDSLGSTLVRSIALVEQAQEPLKSTRVLSMLKELRDDLRQVIDSNSPTQCAENLTPAEWIAPLRQRFVRLFDEQGIASRWQMPPKWPCQIASSQRMELTRFIEEALSNAVLVN